VESASAVPEHVVDYLNRQRTLTLATVDADGRPNAATLVYVNDGPRLYLWVHQSASMASALADQADVAFAIADYAEDWRQTRGIRGRGRCETVSGDELGTAADLFGTRFPDLRPGATSAVTFLRITPSELRFIDNTRGEGEPERDEYRSEPVL
jgi:uncharacterized protein YhbP (UPF0306 family)